MPASKTPSTSESHDLDTEKFRQEQVLLLYSSLSNALFANIFNAVILVVVLWQVINPLILLAWLMIILLVAASRGVGAYLYTKAGDKDDDKWYKQFYIGVFLSALSWAAVSIWLFPENDPTRQVFIAFAIGGMVAGAITTLSAAKQFIYLFIVVALLPLIIRFFTADAELNIAMGLMLSLYLGLMLVSANRTYLNIRQNILLHSVNRESEHRYQTLLNTATDAFYLHDIEGNLVDTNKEACQSLGYNRDELLGMTIFDIDQDSSKYDISRLVSMLEQGQHIRLERIHCRKNGECFPVELSLAQLEMKNKKFISIIARDITERQRIDKMKNEFISTVSHELRTPLTSIRGSLGLILGGAMGELDSKLKSMLDLASNNTERLLHLINDILDIQKIESGQMQFEFSEIDLAPFLQQVIIDNEPYAVQHHVEFIITDSLENAVVSADRYRLMQVMANLLSNAAKFSPAGSKVEIALTKSDNDYRITVTDHGAGIPPEFHKRIFNRFTQVDSSDSREKGGTGLGLNISRLIIEKHRGEIGVNSVPGEGSSFYFNLPQRS